MMNQILKRKYAKKKGNDDELVHKENDDNNSKSTKQTKKKQLKQTARAATRVSEDILKNMKIRNMNKKGNITSDSESSDDDPLLSHVTQLSKYDVETLKADNRALKLENRKLKEAIEDMKEIKNIMKGIRDRVMKIEKGIDKLAGTSDTNKQENANDPIDNILFDGTLPSVYIDPPLHPETCNANGENVTVVIPLNNTVETVKSNNNNPCQPENPILIDDAQKQNSENNKDGRYFGFQYITNVQLGKLNNSTISALTSELLSLVFDKNELWNSSLTGKTANPNKSKDCPKAAVQQLDPVRVSNIEAYLFEKFPKTGDSVRLFRYAIRNKCNNAKK